MCGGKGGGAADLLEHVLWFYLVFLLRSAYLVVQLGVVERQPAVHSKRLECFLVFLNKNVQLLRTWSQVNIRAKLGLCLGFEAKKSLFI